MKLPSLLAAAALTLAVGPTFAQTKLTLGHGAAPEIRVTKPQWRLPMRSS